MVSYRWSIFWADLNPVVGSEQAGHRPVLVVSAEEANQALPIVAILPLSSYRRGRKVYPTEVFLSVQKTGLSKDSLVLAHQIRTIAKERLAEKSGEVADEELRGKISNALGRFLGWI
jgi:mRNA interferase MazF